MTNQDLRDNAQGALQLAEALVAQATAHRIRGETERARQYTPAIETAQQLGVRLTALLQTESVG